ncbi:MAG TPA: NYN domain-containing protein [Candidatus Nanoarchaeia archaeon]|nr:NYN domain-containing protein [Candidatus Nanoarchaeia archaeon]
MTLEKTAVLIDGGYFGKISKHFGNGKHLSVNIVTFSKYLSIKKGLWMNEIIYYTAPPFQSTPPTEEEIKRKGGYDRFISKLTKHPEVTVREGRVQKLEEYKQKGVDTLLVMDLMSFAISKKYKKIILLACDTDFVPVIRKLEKDDGITTILYYYSDRIRKSKFSMSNEILDICREKSLLTKEHFTRHLYH